MKQFLSSKSPIVAGAIPFLIWVGGLHLFVAYVLAPLLSPWVTSIIAPLPDYYTSMLSTIIVGLFAKKAFDSADIKVGGVHSPRKRDDEA